MDFVRTRHRERGNEHLIDECEEHAIALSLRNEDEVLKVYAAILPALDETAATTTAGAVDENGASNI